MDQVLSLALDVWAWFVSVAEAVVTFPLFGFVVAAFVFAGVVVAVDKVRRTS